MTSLRLLQQAWPSLLVTPIPALAIAILGLQAETPSAWRFALLATTGWSVYAWWYCEQRRRAIANTPQTSIRAAPQGYVRLAGIARATDLPQRSPGTGLPCAWFRQQIEKRESSAHQFRHFETRESEACFLLIDGKEQLVLDPLQAEFDVTHKEVRTQGDYRTTEWIIHLEQAIYVMGEFRTRRADENLNLRNDISSRLADWKEDRHILLQRFDRDSDGQIDMQEWESVRAAAQQEVALEHRTLATAAPTHFLEKPADGRPCLIATRDPASILWRFRLGRWLHITLTVLALHGLYYQIWHPDWLPFAQ
jgi:hypothetical protein